MNNADTLANAGNHFDKIKITDALYWENKVSDFLNFIPTIIFAIIVLILGFKLCNLVVRILSKIMRRRGCEESVIGFTATTVNVVLKVIVVMSFIGILGIDTSAFIATLGAAGLAVGLALQGTLQNFAGGVIILVLKPFRTGDLVEFGGHKGTVQEIRIFNTVIDKFATNETVIVPNSAIASGTLINWKSERERRIQASFSVAYGEDISLVRAIVLEMAERDSRLLDIDKEVIVTALADSSVNMELRVWVRPMDYITVSSDMLENIYNILNENNISIPFPQLDVKLKE
ncbi:MAG: mechanosensitive ion channel [Rikenellaceae bacterium]